MIARKVRRAIRARALWAKSPRAVEYFEGYERALAALSPSEAEAYGALLARSTRLPFDARALPANDNALGRAS